MHIMMDAAASGSKLLFGDNVVTAILGYGVVFAGLMVLMGIVYGMGAIFKAIGSREKPLAAAPVPKINKKSDRMPAEPMGEPARGSAGEIKLYDVSDKEAAMIMAIVASQMGKPLNELRFKSIKEVKNDEV
jgi:Na+-transporting methylmalonyl-CoA/oxaloacetate decarboxylase gamma subunit